MAIRMTPELEIARSAAAVAGNVLARWFGKGITIRGKEAGNTYNVVTNADTEAEQAIVEVIRAARPGDAILGEEGTSADVTSEHLWVIDPLDGTNNFVHGIPHFAISIAYYHQGRAQCGVILNPIHNDWYLAVRETGAYWNDRRVTVADHQRLDQAMIGVGFYYDRGAMMEATLAALRDLFRGKIHGIRRIGAASLDLCYVGCGLFSAYFEYQLSFWDFAAGRLFVEEAGGQVTDCRGEALPPRTTSILASNGKLHSDIAAIVGNHYRSDW